MKNKGHLIVIEGTDGVGKTTQIKLLKQHLASQGWSLQAEVIDFPRYKDNEYGKLVKRYLLGEFGKLEVVSPYLASLAYAGDRMLAAPQIRKWLDEGKLVIANRYVSANKGHMSAKLEKSEKQKYLDWIDNLEYKENQIPREDLVILLFVNPEIAQENVKARGGQKDIHETDFNYQKKVADVFLKLSKQEKNWILIDCAKNHKMKKPEEVHQEILSILKKKNIL